jgi:HK97 gp10 family phage protein
MSFTGGRELEAALADLGKRTTAKRTAERALKKAAQPIRDKWQQLVPVGDGDLKRSIKIGKAVKGVQRQLRGSVAAIFVGIDETEDKRLRIYGPVQEFGNESNPAQPAGRPAFEATKHEALDRLADDLWAEIEKTKARAAKKAAKLASGAG